MEQNKKEVIFDGKDLIFNVDGIEVKNGKLPDSFSIKECYEISAESLTNERYKRYMLEKLIKEHNKRSWWGRTERIELEMEE